MFLSKEEFVLLIAIAAGIPLVLIGFAAFLLIRHNNLSRTKQIEIRDAMLITQENERKRIARDLHDHIGPLLMGIKLGISFKLNQPTENQIKNFEKAKRDCDQTIIDVRIISHDLYSTNITSIGLAGSLKETISSLDTDEKKIDFNFTIDETKLSYEFKINLYRICMELINNSLKHCNGDTISLSLAGKNRDICLEYFDNGISQKIIANKGIGIENIKNRIQLLNGEIIDFSEDFSKGARYKIIFKQL